MPVENIQSRIFTIRGLQVMVDRDLAQIYGVQPRRLNEQVKRNIERFPESFRFQLTKDEFENFRSQALSASDQSLRSQIATLESRGEERYIEKMNSCAMMLVQMKTMTDLRRRR